MVRIFNLVVSWRPQSSVCNFYPDSSGTSSNHRQAVRFCSWALPVYLTTFFTLAGQDIPENVAGGLRHAVNTSWESPSCLCILIANASCHGSIYHSCRIPIRGVAPRGRTHRNRSIPFRCTQMVCQTSIFLVSKIEYEGVVQAFYRVRAFTAGVVMSLDH